MEFYDRYSKAYIDILHNNVETTATCEILGNFAKSPTNIWCVSDYEIQTKNDEIKINSKKNMVVLNGAHQSKIQKQQ